jgi:methylene-fatty-acyl-phospholipid synthase
MVAAVLLAIERVTYVWIWRRPDSFPALCRRAGWSSGGAAVHVLERLFWGFKLLQLLVFIGWCYAYANGSVWPAATRAMPAAIGTGLIVVGQILNLGVFYRLGLTGVFYGSRFGYEIEWSTEFPFSILSHPQYVGAVTSIWGFFIAMRFPHPDWFLVPMLETIYYSIGAWLEG